MNNQIPIEIKKTSRTRKVLFIISGIICALILFGITYVAGVFTNTMLKINLNSPVDQKIVAKLIERYGGLSQSTVNAYNTSNGRIYEVKPCSSNTPCQTKVAALRFSNCHFDVGNDYYNAWGLYLTNCNGNFKTFNSPAACAAFFNKLDDNSPDFTTAVEAKCN